MNSDYRAHYEILKWQGSSNLSYADMVILLGNFDAKMKTRSLNNLCTMT